MLFRYRWKGVVAVGSRNLRMVAVAPRNPRKEAVVPKNPVVVAEEEVVVAEAEEVVAVLHPERWPCHRRLDRTRCCLPTLGGLRPRCTACTPGRGRIRCCSSVHRRHWLPARG